MEDELRVDPQRASVSNLPLLAGLPPGPAERKLQRLQKGLSLQQQLPLFPDAPKLRDVPAVVALLLSFLILMVAGMGCRLSSPAAPEPEALAWVPEAGDPLRGAHIFRRLDGPESVAHGTSVSQNILVVTATLSCVGGFFMALAALQLLHLGAEKALLGCTLLRPSLKIVLGAACFVMSYQAYPHSGPQSKVEYGFKEVEIRDDAFAFYTILGFLFVPVGLCDSCLGCVTGVSGRAQLPLQASLMKVVSGLVLANRDILAIPLLCAGILFVWVLACNWAFLWIVHIFVSKEAVFPTLLLIAWGAGVASYVSILAFCDVYSRWYYERGGDMMKDGLRTAVTSGLGSACFAAVLVAPVRILEMLARNMQPGGPNCTKNPCSACLTLSCSCVLNTIFAATGDLSEYVNTWAFTQCALRNASFMEAAAITYMFCTCSNVTLIKRGLLLNYITGSAVWTGGLLGFILGGVAHGLGGYPQLFFAPAVGMGCGMMTTSIVLSVAKTGFKALLVMWAEDPGPLECLAPDAHEAIQASLRRHLEVDMRHSSTELTSN